MKYSKLFGKTEKNIPSQIKLISHKLLYQAGFIRELAAGRYELLPLGAKVYQNVIKIIDKEMESIGSQRVYTPTLHPKEIWQKTGRDEVWGKDLLFVKDERTKQEFALAATGEGLFTEMVKDFSPSYRDLPIILHQFSQKFRNEKRPRGGLIRLREFLMKDAYSFDADAESFKKTYKLFYDSYIKIAEILELKVIPVEADNGALGGNYSHEFMVEADFGEDTIVKCDKCDYCANTERAEFIKESESSKEKEKPYQVVDLPYGVATIKELVAHYRLPADRFIKNVVYKSTTGKIIIATLTGNLEVNEVKLKNLLKADGDFEPATDEDLASFGSKSGFVHSWGYKNPRIIYVADDIILQSKNLYGGFKTDTTDPINVNYGRDFKADLVGNITSAYEGAKCLRCGTGNLQLTRAIEFGHVFSYEDFYSKAHKAFYRDKDGKEKLLLMGAYGIGIERAIAVIVETHHDEKGIIWPESVAPFNIHLIGLDLEDKEMMEKAEKTYKLLEVEGIEVLFDDRIEVSAGEKFADADLIGIPLRVVVSKRNQDELEIKKRNQKETEFMDLTELIKIIPK